MLHRKFNKKHYRKNKKKCKEVPNEVGSATLGESGPPKLEPPFRSVLGAYNETVPVSNTYPPRTYMLHTNKIYNVKGLGVRFGSKFRFVVDLLCKGQIV